MLRQLMARVMMTTGLAAILQSAHAAQNAVNRAPPPVPRSNSHAGKHYPRHSTNAAGYFPHRSGEGPRECGRRVRQQLARELGWIK